MRISKNTKKRPPTSPSTPSKPGPKSRKKPRKAPDSDAEVPIPPSTSKLPHINTPHELDFSPGSTHCLFCLDPNVLPSQNILNFKDIEALCHVLNLGDMIESRALFAGSSYCSKCISVIRHIHTLLEVLEIERKYIMGQLLANHGGNMTMGVGNLNTTVPEGSRARRKAALTNRNKRDHHFEYYGEEVESLNRSKQEDGAHFLIGNNDNNPTVNGTRANLLRTLAQYSEPVLIYDDEQILGLINLDDDTEDDDKSYRSKPRPKSVKPQKRPSSTNTTSTSTQRECPTCGKLFTRNYRYKEHLKKHIKEKRYTCTECDQVIFGPTNLKLHMENEHQIEPPEEVLSLATSAEESSTRTRKSLNPPDPRPCPDPDCNETFLTKKELDRHCLIHKPNFRKRSKPGTSGKFICGECGGKFTRSTHLRRHMQIHKGKSDIRCDICDKGFTEAYGLKRHVNTAHSEIDSNTTSNSQTQEDEEEEVQAESEDQEQPEVNEVITP